MEKQALYLAARENNLKMLKELIILGADVDTADNDGNTALHGLLLNHLEIKGAY